ncbi:HD-GYP domain-containing protein [Thiorhodococcus minor]|uniref:HD-GYP domain-containing protein n=1 Tax=Thiorhodococcus minor TaxID=57489 RepID=A0A6M0JWI1_9GAMM|nr:HD-GYP domain-containing protein [Thiorhodococcus minor]NEV60963.1 HD-GYP domain-containing protein [Thiorhodococcus minor]
MIKKIAIDQLQVGMYVHDLNCGWMDHGFLRSQFAVKSPETLQQIRRTGTRELYIDTEKGADASPAPSEAEVIAGLEGGLGEIAQDEHPDARPVSLAQERAQAKRIHGEAVNLVAGLMEDVRLGRQIDLERTQPVVGAMVGSIFRNPNALMGLARIRRMDRYTFEHSVNVSVLMVSFARSLELDQNLIHEIGMGALLHDIGKILVPPEILNKPGKLTDAEFVVMRNHVVHSRDTLAKIPGFPPAALAVAAEHHERADGSGYPGKKDLKGISLAGKMASIVDVYDAITSDRVYHKGMEPHQALRKLLEWSAHHFDPQLVQQFVRCVGIYPVGTLVMLESGRLGVVLETGREELFHPVVRVVMDAKHRRYLPVEDLDLARQPKGRPDRILSAESPQRWRIEPEEILQMPLR